MRFDPWSHGCEVQDNLSTGRGVWRAQGQGVVGAAGVLGLDGFKAPDVDAGTCLADSITVTGAKAHDLDEVANRVRAGDEVVYADAGDQGVERQPASSTTRTCRGCSVGFLSVKAR